MTSVVTANAVIPPSGDPRRPLKWVRSELILWRVVPNGVLMLGPGDAAPVLVSGAGAVVWALLERPIGEAALIDAVADELAVETEVVKVEVRGFIADLRCRGFAVQVP